MSPFEKVMQFNKDHKIASGIIVATTIAVVYQRVQIKALKSFARFMIEEAAK